MKFHSIFKRILILALFIVVLIGMIILGRGYRINVEQKELNATAILVANSTPDGAKVMINGQLKGATDSNIFLTPGEYLVEIQKDGFTSWSKTMKIKGEWVININPNLFPLNPSLSPVTTLGIVKALVSPSGNKLILLTQTDDPEKNGIYQLDNNKRPISIINPLKLIAQDSVFGQQYAPESATITFSPDEKQMLISFSPSSSLETSTYLLDVDSLATQALDVSQSVPAIKAAWSAQQIKNTKKIIETYKKPFPKVATDNFYVISFSPDEKKILYTVKNPVTLPVIIKPRLIATNQTEEVRNLVPGELYVYDKTEDKNFKIETPLADDVSNTQSVLWYTDSNHLVVRQDKNIAVVDYDGTNKRVLYAGPFMQNFLSVSSDGRLFILANLNPENNEFPDLYAVGVK